MDEPNGKFRVWYTSLLVTVKMSVIRTFNMTT